MASSEFAAATQVDDARLRDVLVGLAEPTAPVPIGQYVTVQERWRSPYGSATRRYLVRRPPH